MFFKFIDFLYFYKIINIKIYNFYYNVASNLRKKKKIIHLIKFSYIFIYLFLFFYLFPKMTQKYINI